MRSKTRILIVEDSFLMQKIISDIVSSDPGFEVIDKARDGKEALEKVFALRPDVVTLDVNLPLLDGLSVLGEIMRKHPARVIMLSAYTRQEADTTIKALELGAIDFISKPSGEISLGLHKLKDEIISKIKIASGINLERFLSTLKRPSGLRLKPVLRPEASKIKKIVVIGASTGGPRAILQIMQGIPADIPASFLIVQHMPEHFTLSFAERITSESRIKTKEAEKGDLILPGKAYIAPGGWHMVMEKLRNSEENKLKITLNQDALVNYLRPSVDVTMKSVADIFGPNVIGVMLSGMGKDGLEGTREIKKRGGLVIVQDEATSVVWGMPRAVVDQGFADQVRPLWEITASIIKGIER